VWIRWATLEGAVLATPQELTQAAQQQAQEAQQKAERLAAKLRELGINPERV
jgi:phage-related minor tail protein